MRERGSSSERLYTLWRSILKALTPVLLLVTGRRRTVDLICAGMSSISDRYSCAALSACLESGPYRLMYFC